MNDLEWLARHVHEWPTLNNGVECEMIYRHDAISTGWGRQWPTDPLDGSEVTRDQWLAERARLQNKPIWEDAPEWANYLVQLHSGQWRWYDVKPFAEGGVWNLHCFARWKDSPNVGEVLGEFSDTLEPRPEEQTMTKKEWRGPEDGLPPVGSIVAIAESGEYLKIRYPSGAEVKIYAHFTDGRGVELAAFVDDYGQVGGIATAKCFRPIRTEEDLAVEDMINIIAEAFSKSGDEWADNEDIARAIYAAGYRKQEPSE